MEKSIYEVGICYNCRSFRSRNLKKLKLELGIGKILKVKHFVIRIGDHDWGRVHMEYPSAVDFFKIIHMNDVKITHELKKIPNSVFFSSSKDSNITYQLTSKL